MNKPYPTSASRTPVDFPHPFIYYCLEVFGQEMTVKLVQTPLYTVEDYKITPFAALGFDGPIHAVFQPETLNHIGLFMHEMGHLAHWYWDPWNTSRCSYSRPSRLEVCANVACWRHLRLTSSIAMAKFLDVRLEFGSLSERQDVAVARLIERVDPTRKLKGIFKDILRGQAEFDNGA